VNTPDTSTSLDTVAESTEPGHTGFQVRLENFTGPFDLLLQLIGKHKLDVTEVALHKVTDEFIAYTKGLGDQWDLDEASEFLLIAATLLDLKAARLLPSAEVEDEEDLALLEVRDLLFARLLQYKAFKEAASRIEQLSSAAALRFPRTAGLEPRYAAALPELVLSIGPDQLAVLAAAALRPKPPPTVATEHVHMVRVSVREHAIILQRRLRRIGASTFRSLTSDCESTLEVVARFLALLELYREGLIGFDQVQALGELTVRWTAGDRLGDIEVDEYAGAPDDEVDEAEPAEPGEAADEADPAATGGEAPTMGEDSASPAPAPDETSQEGT